MTQYFPLAQKMATLAQEALFFFIGKVIIKTPNNTQTRRSAHRLCKE